MEKVPDPAQPYIWFGVLKKLGIFIDAGESIGYKYTILFDKNWNRINGRRI